MFLGHSPVCVCLSPQVLQLANCSQLSGEECGQPKSPQLHLLNPHVGFYTWIPLKHLSTLSPFRRSTLENHIVSSLPFTHLYQTAGD